MWAGRLAVAVLMLWGTAARGQAAPPAESSAAQAAPVAMATGSQAAQTGAGAPLMTLKIGTRLVGVSALVLDKQSVPVSGLKATDFALLEDGKPQPIAFFSEEQDQPLTLALMIDTSTSQTNFIRDETEAARLFFAAMLTRPEDRAMLVQFDTDALVLQGLTNSAATLQAALGRLGDPHPPAWLVTRHGGGTLLYDAIGATCYKILGKEAGRRAMVLLTDGGDNGSTLSLEQAVIRAQQADTVVYSVFYSEQEADSYGKRVLEALSSTTGGRVFEVNRKTPLAVIFKQIEEDMRLQYQIGYHPPASAPGTYHRIDLKTADKHLKVSARTGYYTKHEAVTPANGNPAK